jgi:hypothetical protein
MVAAFAHTPPPLPVAILLSKAQEDSDNVLESDAIAPPLSPARFDVKFEPESVTELPDVANTAPPWEVVALFISNMSLLEVRLLADRLTAPPVIIAIFKMKMVEVVEAELSYELDMMPYTAPPDPVVASFDMNVQPAMSVTAAPSSIRPPPFNAATLEMKLQDVSKVTSVAVHTPPPDMCALFAFHVKPSAIVHMLFESNQMPPPLSEATLFENVEAASDTFEFAEAMAPPFDMALLDVKFVFPLSEMLLLDVAKMAPPWLFVAKFMLNMLLTESMEELVRLTAPPVSAAVLFMNVLPVATIVLASRLTAPPTPPAVFSFHMVPTSALVTTLPDSPCTAPPSVAAALLVKLVPPEVVKVEFVRKIPPPVVDVASFMKK